MYFLWAAFFFLLPTLLTSYKGHTGKFLVSTDATRGTVFEKTVIYLDYHSGWGAHGVIINKALSYNAPRPAIPIEKEEAIALMLGGPVEQTAKWFFLDGMPPVMTEYNSLVQPPPYQDKIVKRVYAGYAGWGPLQLNREIAFGGWNVVDYDADIMYNTPPEKIWTRLMEKISKENPVPANGA